ncbi:fungal-specific transcription factor domain-containing protein [Gloeopeniophorella convolvens]|nr:fungal-specific transcription factor domain-containing protein [Gloeopeniophorella convolvens]
MSPTPAEDAIADKSSSILKERRFKLSRACDRCRRRRIKCDEGHPCQACLGANSSCTFEEPGKRSHPHKSKRTATLEDRMHHLESLIQAIPPAVFAAGGAATTPSSPFDPHPSFPLVSNHTYPAAVPPPSLSVIPLMNPSTHFTLGTNGSRQSSPQAVASPFGYQGTALGEASTSDHASEEIARMALSSSYLYVDDEGFTRWQGETSGLPILDLLIERHNPPPKKERDPSPQQDWSNGVSSSSDSTWFPDRTTHRTDMNPERIWKLITSFIAPDLMDSLVQCFLSTSYYIMPFLHVPTFLSDYGDPQKWGEPGFAAFVVAVCCLASRHIDDPRVRADPNDGVSSGTQWFDLFGRLRTLPGADRPTLYTIQATLVAGVYAIGWGKLSKAFALISESVTLSLDAGLHRSSDAYDIFDAIEEEVRKRTFWCVYMWDKQAGAHFGRPPLVRLRDCDVAEPAAVDDEFISRDSVGPQPAETPSRMGAFLSVLRLIVVLESVLDAPPPKDFGDASPFLKRATSILVGFRRHKGLREEEALLDDVCNAVPAYWRHSPETLASEDVIRVTHAERVYCLSLFVRMLIMRHRFSDLVAERAVTGEQEQAERERDAMTVAHSAALQLISTHLQIAQKGLMTYYGVHVIHQLTQAGRTLVGFLLNCQSDMLRPLITPALDGLRSCVGLLRRFSGRYVCGQRSCDMMEEFCRSTCTCCVELIRLGLIHTLTVTQIPLDNPTIPQELLGNPARPPWLRPVRKKNPSAPRSTGSMESPPQDPGEFGSPMSAAPNSSFLSNTFSPVPKAQSPRRYSMDATSPTAQFLDASGTSGLELPKPDPGAMPMGTADLMALFGESGLDVAGLFPQPALPEFTTELPGDSPYGAAFARRTSHSSNEMVGIVGSP